MHISALREARTSERAALSKAVNKLQQHSAKKTRRKPPIFYSLKKRLDKHFRAISQQSELFPIVQNNGKQDRLVSSRSKDAGFNDYSHEDGKVNDHGTGGQVDSSSLKSSDRVSNRASGSQKHNETDGSVKKKRKYENLSCHISVPLKLPKREKIELDVLPTESDTETNEVSYMHKLDLSIANNLLRMFITTWKEACREQPVAEVCSCCC